MELGPILQAVADNDNPDYVETNGPFLSTHNTWLGRGYYFWERFDEVAHWWGQTHYNDNYMICEASAGMDENEYLDLVGNTVDMRNFHQMCNQLENTFNNHLSICFVIEYMRKHELFPYKAIRAHSIDCGEGDGYVRMPFIEKHKSYLNLMPAIQICVFDKSCVRNYHIIYPEEYIQVV